MKTRTLSKINIKVTRDETHTSHLIQITRADYIGDYRIHLVFNDGREKIVDFKPFLLNPPNPLFKKYLDETEFKKFRLIHGNLDWNAFEKCFPIADLYEGTITSEEDVYA